jgi:hypothetical protein
MRYEHVLDDHSYPNDITADGISDAVGRTRAQMSITIKDAADKGWVTYKLHRLIDGRTRKVAVITDAGRVEAAEARRLIAAHGLRPEQVIRAPNLKTCSVRTTELSERAAILQQQLNDLRRQIDNFIGGMA